MRRLHDSDNLPTAVLVSDENLSIACSNVLARVLLFRPFSHFVATLCRDRTRDTGGDPALWHPGAEIECRPEGRCAAEQPNDGVEN